MENEEYKVKLIKPGEIEGCNIGGILAIPKKISTNKMLVMIKEEKHNNIMKSRKNGEKKVAKSFEDSANRLMDEENFTGITKFLNIDGQMILIPMLPNESLIQEEGKSKGTFGAELLVKECFTNIPQDSKFYRLDRQMSTLIQSVIEKYELDKKVNLFGHSASGLAAMRLAMTNPDLIDNLIIGGNADEIPVPVSEYSQNLDYPFGTRDFKQLFEKNFDEKSFRGISFRFYIGEYEYADPNLDGIRKENYGTKRDGTLGSGTKFAPEEAAKAYKNIFNSKFKEDDELSVFERMENVLADYEKNDLDIKVKVYEKDCHGLILGRDLENAQFENGIVFFSNPSQIIKGYLEKAINIKRFVERNPHLEEVKDYIEASHKIKFNKQAGDVETRINALKKVDELANGIRSNEYKKNLEGMNLSNYAVETLSDLRRENIEIGELCFIDIASKVVPVAKADVKQNMQRIEHAQAEKDKDEKCADQKKE